MCVVCMCMMHLVYVAARTHVLLASLREMRVQAAEEKLAADNEMYAKIKLDFDRSRATVTRTNYEVDFIEGFTKLAALGAKFNPVCNVLTARATTTLHTSNAVCCSGCPECLYIVPYVT